MIEEGIRALLVAAATAAAGRIYPWGLAPEAPTSPWICYQLISARPSHAHDGPSDLQDETLQVSAFARGRDSYTTARALASQIRSTLDGYAGAAGSHSIKAALLETAFLAVEPDDQMTHFACQFRIEYL